MKTATETYTFTYRGYTIEQYGHTYSIIQNGEPTGGTHSLIDLIRTIDLQWDKN